MSHLSSSEVLRSVESPSNRERQKSATATVSLAGAATVLFYLLGRHLLLDTFILIRVSSFSIACTFLIPEVLARITKRPDFLAKIFAHRGWVMSTLLILCLAFALLLAVTYRPWKFDTFTRESALTFLIQGALVGGYVRTRIVAYLERALTGMSTDAAEAMFLGMVSVFLILFPTSKEHSILAVPYLVGVSGGLFVHFTVRGSMHEAAFKERMGQNLGRLVRGSSGHWRVLEAAKLYADQNLSKLSQHLEVYEEHLRTEFVIISASKERVEKNFEKAFQLVDDELRKCDPGHRLYRHLLLLKAFCLADLKADTKEMLATLDQALSANPNCLLANIAWGLWTAESIPLESVDEASVATLEKAFLKVQEAFVSACKDKPDMWSGITGVWVPFTSTFLLDSYGYVALRNGDTRSSRLFFDYCIKADSKFASPYLHLAEWYLINGFDSAGDEDIAARNRRIARLCLCIAIDLEGERTTFTKIRAQKLLHQYF